MALHVFERPAEAIDAQEAAAYIAVRTGLPAAEAAKVLEQEGFYLRGHGTAEGGVVRLPAEATIDWIAERLRIKRNRVRSILEAYSDFLRERGLLQPAA